jgi:hypothetical protein
MTTRDRSIRRLRDMSTTRAFVCIGTAHAAVALPALVVIAAVRERRRSSRCDGSTA